MSKTWKLFIKVLSSYTMEEKIFSLLILIVIFTVGIQGIVEVFKNPYSIMDSRSFYTEGLINEKTTIVNPLYADFSDANREISSLVFSGLTKYDPTKKSFVSDLGTLTVSEDKKTYKFVLKDNVFWHDGQLLTADDVYFTYHDIIQSPDFQNPVIKANFDGVGIKEVDKKTLTFTLDRPNSFFITNLSVGVLPKHLLSNIQVVDLPYANFNLNPVGTGPYKVADSIEVSNDGKQHVTLVAYDKFYGGTAKVKNIKFNIYPNEADLVKDKGTLNVIDKVSTTMLDEISRIERFNLMNYNLPQYTAVFFNMNNVALAKSKVRLALQKSIDKVSLMQIFDNKSQVDTPLMDLNQSDWLYKVNLDEAKGALFDSGFKIDKTTNDIYRKDSKGNTLTFKLLVRKYEEGSSMNDEIKKLVAFLKESWDKIGVKLDVQYAEVEDYNSRLAAKDYDLIIAGQSLGYNLDTFSYWHSSQTGEGGLNLSNYKSFAVDSLIEKIRNTFDEVEKQKLLKQLAEVIAKDMPAIFLYRPNYIYATDGKLKGIDLNNLVYPADRFYNVINWCIQCAS